jgi:arginine-tRNA-protein transferase
MTAPYPCSYFRRSAGALQVATPAFPINGPVYSQLVHHGFRRSGTYTYRPQCDDCRAHALRVLANTTANRLQARPGATRPSRRPACTPARQSGITAFISATSARHPNGGMDNDDRESYRQNFLPRQCRFAAGGIPRALRRSPTCGGALRMVT